jgi:hypothetical protein
MLQNSMVALDPLKPSEDSIAKVKRLVKQLQMSLS